jgi:hypothetical protein
MLPFQYIYTQKTELTGNGNFSFCCKWKMEMANFCLFSAKGKWKFVLLGRQTNNGNRCPLFQQMCPSMLTCNNTIFLPDEKKQEKLLSFSSSGHIGGIV